MKNQIIIVQIKGGLGNQMFQYALGRRLALEQDVPLKLDISWFNEQEKRNFELDQFNIDAKTITPRELKKFPAFSKSKFIRRIYRIIAKKSPYYDRFIFSEQKSGTFDPRVLMGNKTKYLEGYWQSEKYFKSIEHQIRADFILKTPLSLSDQHLADEMSNNPYSVSVHIRRGDYVSENVTVQAHYVCTPDYYHKTMRIINKRLAGKAYFYIFSDDPGWCLAGVQYPSEFKIVSNLKRSTSHELILMSKCRHSIMANSSFSWWGAWLIPDVEKIVIYPKIWLNNKTTPDIPLNNWFAFRNDIINN